MEKIKVMRDMLALEDTLRVGISQSLGMTNEQLFDTIDELKKRENPHISGDSQ